MKVSIRETLRPSGYLILQAYRGKERKPLSAHAEQTPSSYWIVHLPGQLTDVAENEADAAFALQEYYEAQK